MPTIDYILPKKCLLIPHMEKDLVVRLMVTNLRVGVAKDIMS